MAAIEFAIVAPLLIMMMFGMIMYGSWFWMAHSVQSMAFPPGRIPLCRAGRRRHPGDGAAHATR
ncbi:MAG TPA: TadE family protein, partial [Brevundimonas sp.]|nr:TadE family protein [Brevundimonas sp.]